jgi:hypothetical protein
MRTAQLIFDASPPKGMSPREHLVGSEEHKGFEGYLLELADFCPGFRVLVCGPCIAIYLQLYVRAFVLERRPFPAPPYPLRIGTWRGHAVYLDETLDPPHERSPRGHLAASVSGPALGFIQVLNA